MKINFLKFLIISSIIFTSILNSYALSSVTKESKDVSTGNINSSTQGNTIDYIIEIKNDGAKIEKPILEDAIPSNTSFVNGSLKYPKGWSSEFSVDNGSTFTTTQSATGINKFKINGLTIPLNSPTIDPNLSASKIKIPVPPPSISTGSSGGDGFAPIVWKNPNGGVIFCEVYHHWNPVLINCQDGETGSNISGFPKTLIDSATSSNYISAYDNFHVSIGSKSYFAFYQLGTTKRGVFCYDLSTLTDCGFTAISNAGRQTNANFSFGLIQIGKFFYTSDYLGTEGAIKVFCYDTSTNDICTGVTVDGYLTNVDNGSVLTLANINDKLIVQGTGATTNGINCYNIDSTTGALTQCTGTWPQIGGAARGIARAHYTVAGVIDGMCTFGNAAPSNHCYDFSGNDTTGTMMPGFISEVNSDVIGPDVKSGSKVYYPIFTSKTICWDYATNALCTGFTDGGAGAIDGVRRWTQFDTSGITGKVGSTYDYGYSQLGNCAYGLGDSGLMWSFGLGDGKSPCTDVDTSTPITVDSVSIYCDGSTGPIPVSWDKLMPADNLYPTGVTSTIASIYTDNTFTVPMAGFDKIDVPASGLDISSISIISNPTLFLKVSVVSTLATTFDMLTTFKLDKPQKYYICYKVKINDACDIGQITNNISVNDSDGTVNHSNITTVANGSSCTPKNLAPIANADKFEVAQNATTIINPLVNDTDPNLKKLQLSSINNFSVKCINSTPIKINIDGGYITISCLDNLVSKVSVSITSSKIKSLKIPYSIVNESNLSSNSTINLVIVKRLATTGENFNYTSLIIALICMLLPVICYKKYKLLDI